MIAFLKELLRSPEAQREPHYWASVYGGHAYLALGPWGILAIYSNMWTAAWVVPVLYLMLWELPQFLLSDAQSSKLAWDCLLDTVAVAFSCYAATFLGSRDLNMATLCWGASVGVMIVGVRKRQ